MHARTYAEALYRATANATLPPERIIDALLSILAERGHTRLLPRIVGELERLERMRAQNDLVSVHVARAGDVPTFDEMLTRDLTTLAGSSPVEVVDPSLIGGYELRVRGMRIDRSYKRRLIDLYETLTH